jgi:hypothetical protein
LKRLALVFVLSGCSVVDQPYPLAWEPLPDARAPDCQRFAGTYADRGESPGQESRPSLTRELFGEASAWESAQTVRLELTTEGATVMVSGTPKPLAHHFSAKAGDFRCDEGKLVLRVRRWVTTDIMSGRETVRMDLHEGDPYLVAHLRERMTGVMFMVVPLAGESARWFRFRRLQP